MSFLQKKIGPKNKARIRIPAAWELPQRIVRWKVGVQGFNMGAFLTERSSCLCGDEGKTHQTVWRTNIRKKGGNQRSKGQVWDGALARTERLFSRSKWILRYVLAVGFQKLFQLTPVSVFFVRLCTGRRLAGNFLRFTIHRLAVLVRRRPIAASHVKDEPSRLAGRPSYRYEVVQSGSKSARVADHSNQLSSVLNLFATPYRLTFNVKQYTLRP